MYNSPLYEPLTSSFNISHLKPSAAVCRIPPAASWFLARHLHPAATRSRSHRAIQRPATANEVIVTFSHTKWPLTCRNSQSISCATLFRCHCQSCIRPYLSSWPASIRRALWPVGSLRIGALRRLCRSANFHREWRCAMLCTTTSRG